MADTPTVQFHIRISREMAHEQVLKLQCEYSQAVADAYFALAAGEFRLAARAAADAVKAKAKLRRIARWL